MPATGNSIACHMTDLQAPSCLWALMLMTPRWLA